MPRRPTTAPTVCLALVASQWSAQWSQAAVAPKSPAKLAAEAEAVVVGEVIDLQISSARSRIERAFGNYDWLIDLTIRVEQVEKGSVSPGDEITVRCLRIKSRKSVNEFISIDGHSPIPAVGQNVRVHLTRNSRFLAPDGPAWWVVLPNGVQPAAEGAGVTEAPEVAELVASFTYWLPISAWIAVAALAAVLATVLGIVVLVQRSLRRKTAAAQAPSVS